MRRTKWFWTAVAGMVLLGGVLIGCQSEEEKKEDGAIVEGTVLVGWDNPKGKIRVPDGVTDIAEGVFKNQNEITGVVIPSSVVSIGKDAFYSCTGLRNVEIQGSELEIIGDAAFDRCAGLVSINIPNGVTSIGNHAFGLCSSLTTVKIPDSVVTIGEVAFGECRALRDLTIGNGVEELKEGTFRYCTSLTSVTIPDTVMVIEGTVFLGCDKLTTLNISGNWRAERSGFAPQDDVGTITIDMLQDSNLWYHITYYRK